GCPHKRGGVGCTYCAITPELGSRDWRCRPDQPVLEEIAYLAELGMTHIRFADEEFLAGDSDVALPFLLQLQHLVHDLPVTFDAAMRVDNIVGTRAAASCEHLLTS